MFEIIAGILDSTLRMATPILLAGIGETITERSGVLNLGLEGIMLMGAITGFTITFFFNNLWLGVFSAMIVGLLMGLLKSLLSIKFAVNQVLSGLSIFIFGGGLSFFIFRIIFGFREVLPHIKPFETFEIPLLSQIPLIGPILFNQFAITYVALILVIFSYFILFKTTLGLRIRAVGENPKAAETLGINVYHVRYICTILGCILAGIAGAFLSIADTNIFFPGMVAGRGFIAVAIVIFGSWNPAKVLVGALVFGGADSIQLRLQAFGVGFPPEFLGMLPYILTIIALILFSRKGFGPAALGVPYTRGK